MFLPALLAAAAAASPGGAAGTGPPAEDGRSLVLLERSGSPREEATLLEALRIYTRDLALALRSTVMTPGTVTGAARAKAALASCGPDVAVVLWFGGEGARDELQLNALSCDSRTLRSAPLAPVEDLDLAAQTLALKVRGLLARIPSVEREEWQPVTPSPVEREKASPPPAPGGDQRVPAARAIGLDLRAAWGASSGGDSMWLRQGATLGVTLALRRVPLDIGIDGAINMRVNAEPVAGARVSFRDVPISLSVAARQQTGRFALSLGPRIALHLLQLEAQRVSAGQSGSATQTSAGLGGLMQLRYDLWRDVGLVLAATAEILLPRQRFVSGSQTLVDLGYWQWGVTAGLVYRLF